MTKCCRMPDRNLLYILEDYAIIIQEKNNGQRALRAALMFDQKLDIIIGGIYGHRMFRFGRRSGT